MIHLGRILLPRTAWTPPFVLALVVATVEIYLILYLLLVHTGGAIDSFLRYQLYSELVAGGEALEHGLPYEFMKLNLVLGLYLWLMSRTLRTRHDAIHRLGLIGAALVLVSLQILLAKCYALIQPSFELIQIYP